MNDLYITDYCVWIQKASPKQIQKIAAEMDEVMTRTIMLVGIIRY